MILNLALDFCFLTNKLKNAIYRPTHQQTAWLCCVGGWLWALGSGHWPLWHCGFSNSRAQMNELSAMHHFRLAAIAMAIAMAIAHLTTAKAAKVLIVIVTDSEWYYGGLVTSD